jgi:ATP-dependent DNA helicase RecQ
MLTSVQSAAERRTVSQALDESALSLLFVAPERLVLPGFLEGLVARGLASLAVDEAHCISHWGHDFRPEYRQLGELRRLAPGVPIHAFTATATERVRRDVVAELGLVDPLVLVGPCDRPNLTYRVRPRTDAAGQVLEVIRRHPGEAGIVYCIARKEVEALAERLSREGVKAAAYHAGLEPHVRKEVQERFLDEELDVVVATVAFGMGIDRTDVRYVVHAALPKGIEQYSQETGRAGRDGLPSECVLFYSGADFHGWKSLLERGHAEALAVGDAGGTQGLQAAFEGSLERLGQMMSFTTRFVCRHRQIAEHFGQALDPGSEGCGACDVCLGELTGVKEPGVLAQKILSCIVRCEQRYGAAHVTDVLRGASTAGIRRAGHDRLSTWGLLKDCSNAEVRAWIDQLIGLGHVRVAGERYPTLFLSQSGVSVLKGERDVVLFALPGRRKEVARRPESELLEPLDGEPDRELFEALRVFRRELARQRGVPPYLIFNDRTLAQMAARKPRTPEEFRALKGVGEKKAADLGPLFLERIARAAPLEGAAQGGETVSSVETP